jgi:hypothetical protein
MSNDSYTLDPHGDVMLLFPSVSKASSPGQSVETSSQSFTTSVMIDASALEQNTSAVDTVSDPEALTHQPSTSEVSDASEEGHFKGGLVGMRVSSRHLALASPVFSRMFNGNWHEAREIRSEGIAVIIMDIWDVDITLIIMNIMHGYAPKVPRKVDLDTLAKIAVMVDYYQCRGLVEVFADIWIEELKADMPKTFGKAVLQWICIAWVFRKQMEFFAATRVALVESSGVVHTYGLPIPNRVIGSYFKSYLTILLC